MSRRRMADKHANPPRPFLIPAFEAERDGLEEIVGEKLRDI